METSLARKIILESCPFFFGLEYGNLEEVMCGNEGLSCVGRAKNVLRKSEEL